MLVVDVSAPVHELVHDIEILDSPSPVDGHGTLVCAVLRKIAWAAQIRAVGIEDEAGAPSAWSVLSEIAHRRDADVIVACLDVVVGGGRRARADLGHFFARWLADVTQAPLRPLLVFPTGNHIWNSGEPVNTIGMPARYADAIAFGAVDGRGRRSIGSRYGYKIARDGRSSVERPNDWWLVPGGTFDDGPGEPALVRMGGRPQAGTSVAAAVGAGLVAVLLAKLRSRHRRPIPSAVADDPATSQLIAKILDGVPADARADLNRLLEDLQAASRGEVTRWTVLDEMRGMADTSAVPDYEPEKHGSGILRVRPRPE